MDLDSLDLPEHVRERLKTMDSVTMVAAMGMKLISISKEGEVRITMDVSDKLNAVGGGHGGALFCLADQTFAISCNLGEHAQVALSASINYIRPARGTVEAVSRKIAETKQTSLHEVRIFEKGELIAVFQGTGYKLRKRPGESQDKGTA